MSFRDLALPLKFSMCSHERVGWLGSRDFGFSIRYLGNSGWKFGHMNTSALLPAPESEMNSEVRRASFYIACYIFHVISIPFKCSIDNTAIRVTKGMIGAKVITLCFAMFGFFSNLAPELVPAFFLLVSETGLKFLILWTQGGIGSGNRAHMKSP